MSSVAESNRFHGIYVSTDLHSALQSPTPFDESSWKKTFYQQSILKDSIPGEAVLVRKRALKMADVNFISDFSGLFGLFSIPFVIYCFVWLIYALLQGLNQ